MGIAEDLGAVYLEAITIIRTLGEMPGGDPQTEIRRQNKEFTAECGVLNRVGWGRGAGQGEVRERLGRGSPCSPGGGQRKG